MPAEQVQDEDAPTAPSEADSPAEASDEDESRKDGEA